MMPLEAPSLAPRGETVVDLLGRASAADWLAGRVGTYSTWTEPEHRAAMGAAIAESERIAASLRTKAQAERLLVQLGRSPHGSLQDMRLVVQIALMEAWFPPRFIGERVQ